MKMDQEIQHLKARVQQLEENEKVHWVNKMMEENFCYGKLKKNLKQEDIEKKNLRREEYEKEWDEKWRKE